MVKLDCILDKCPIDNKAVDMRKCCGIRNAKPCQYYGARAWSEFAVVSCTHPEAKHETPEKRKINADVFRATAGIGHLTNISF